MTEIHILIIGLALSTFGIRMAGYALGDMMNRIPALERALGIFPGCLVLALIAVAVTEGGKNAVIAAIVAAVAAVVSRNLALTMLAGMGAMAWLQAY